MTEARSIWLKNNAERVRECKRKHAKKAYRLDPEKFSARAKVWRKKNSAAARARDARYRKKYAASRRAQFDAWRRSHREYFQVRHAVDVKSLSNWYVRQKLSRGTSVKPSDWPQALVDAKRAQMKVRRLCQDQKTLKN